MAATSVQLSAADRCHAACSCKRRDGGELNAAAVSSNISAGKHRATWLVPLDHQVGRLFRVSHRSGGWRVGARPGRRGCRCSDRRVTAPQSLRGHAARVAVAHPRALHPRRLRAALQRHGGWRGRARATKGESTLAAGAAGPVVASGVVLRTLQTLVLALVAALATASSAAAFAPESALRASPIFSQTRVGALAAQPREAHQQNTLGYGEVVSDASLAAEGVAGAATTATEALTTTAHGAERIAGAAATRGGVLSEAGVAAVRQGGRVMTQADGAAVRILQNEAGRFNVVVEGERGIITTFENLSQKSMERLGRNYGWK